MAIYDISPSVRSPGPAQRPVFHNSNVAQESVDYSGIVRGITDVFDTYRKYKKEEDAQEMQMALKEAQAGILNALETNEGRGGVKAAMETGDWSSYAPIEATAIQLRALGLWAEDRFGDKMGHLSSIDLSNVLNSVQPGQDPYIALEEWVTESTKGMTDTARAGFINALRPVAAKSLEDAVKRETAFQFQNEINELDTVFNTLLQSSLTHHADWSFTEKLVEEAGELGIQMAGTGYNTAAVREQAMAVFAAKATSVMVNSKNILERAQAMRFLDTKTADGRTVAQKYIKASLDTIQDQQQAKALENQMSPQVADEMNKLDTAVNILVQSNPVQGIALVNQTREKYESIYGDLMPGGLSEFLDKQLYKTHKALATGRQSLQPNASIEEIAAYANGASPSSEKYHSSISRGANQRFLEAIQSGNPEAVVGVASVIDSMVKQNIGKLTVSGLFKSNPLLGYMFNSTVNEGSISEDKLKAFNAAFEKWSQDPNPRKVSNSFAIMNGGQFGLAAQRQGNDIYANTYGSVKSAYQVVKDVNWEDLEEPLKDQIKDAADFWEYIDFYIPGTTEEPKSIMTKALGEVLAGKAPIISSDGEFIPSSHSRNSLYGIPGQEVGRTLNIMSDSAAMETAKLLETSINKRIQSYAVEGGIPPPFLMGQTFKIGLYPSEGSWTVTVADPVHGDKQLIYVNTPDLKHKFNVNEQPKNIYEWFLMSMYDQGSGLIKVNGETATLDLENYRGSMVIPTGVRNVAWEVRETEDDTKYLRLAVIPGEIYGELTNYNDPSIPDRRSGGVSTVDVFNKLGSLLLDRDTPQEERDENLAIKERLLSGSGSKPIPNNIYEAAGLYPGPEIGQPEEQLRPFSIDIDRSLVSEIYRSILSEKEINIDPKGLGLVGITALTTIPALITENPEVIQQTLEKHVLTEVNPSDITPNTPLPNLEVIKSDNSKSNLVNTMAASIALNASKAGIINPHDLVNIPAIEVLGGGPSDRLFDTPPKDEDIFDYVNAGLHHIMNYVSQDFDFEDNKHRLFDHPNKSNGGGQVQAAAFKLEVDKIRNDILRRSQNRLLSPEDTSSTLSMLQLYENGFTEEEGLDEIQIILDKASQNVDLNSWMESFIDVSRTRGAASNNKPFHLSTTEPGFSFVKATMLENLLAFISISEGHTENAHPDPTEHASIKGEPVFYTIGHGQSIPLLSSTQLDYLMDSEVIKEEHLTFDLDANITGINPNFLSLMRQKDSNGYTRAALDAQQRFFKPDSITEEIAGRLATERLINKDAPEVSRFLKAEGIYNAPQIVKLALIDLWYQSRKVNGVSTLLGANTISALKARDWRKFAEELPKISSRNKKGTFTRLRQLSLYIVERMAGIDFATYVESVE